MKYTVKKSLFFLVVLLMTSLLPSATQLHAQSAPFDIIAGFKTVQVAGGETQYCPICYDSPRRTTSHPCSDSELRCYFFEWEFSPNDYSALPKPTRSLPAGTTVNMRYTGIKEEKVGNCLVPGYISPTGACTTHTAMPPNQWLIKTVPNPALANANLPSALPTEFNLPGFAGATTVVAGIAAPHGIPIWDSKMSYPVVIYNPSTMDSAFAVRVSSQLTYARGATTSLATVPNPISSKLGVSNRVDGQDVLLCGIVPAGKCIVFLVQATLPAYDPTNPGQVEITVVTEPNPTKISCPCFGPGIPLELDSAIDTCQKPNLRATRNDTVVSTIDPNQKWVMERQPYYNPGDMVHFTIRCENVGTGNEDIVYLADLFDERFDARSAKFNRLQIRNRDGRLARPTITSAAGTAKVQHDGNLFWVAFSDNEYLLGPNEYAEISISVPFRTDIDTHEGIHLPTWLSRIDTQLVEVPNTAYTMFGMEGVSYEAVCLDGPRLMYTVGQPNWLFWLIVFLIILLLVFLLVLIWRWSRRGRRSTARASALGSTQIA